MTRRVGEGTPVPRQAMVLAAGEGVRMRPLTEERAKPALPLMNRPLLLHVLDFLARQGVEKAVVNLHHQPSTLTRILDAERPGRLNVTLSHEPVILGTGGGIRAALKHLDPDAPLLVANADSLCNADLEALASAHARAAEAHAAPATLTVKAREAGETYSPVHLDPQGRVSGIGDTGAAGEAVTFIGLHVVSPEGLARIPESAPSDIVRHVYLPFLREGRRLGAFRHAGFWIEMGTPALYLRAHLRLLREPAFLSGLPRGCGRVLPGPSPSWIGPGCAGIEGAALEASVLGPGCVLGGEAAIVRSVLAAGIRVGNRARIEDAVIGEGVGIPDGSTVRGCLLMRRSGDASGSTRVLLS